MSDLGYDHKNTAAYYQEAQRARKIVKADIASIDGEAQTMVVSIPDSTPRLETININNMISREGTGIKMMPVPGLSKAILYRELANEWVHIGYALNRMEEITEDALGDKESGNRLLQRYLNAGEIQLFGISGNEIYLDDAGDILIKDKYDSFIKLDSYYSTLLTNSANLKHELDGVRIRAGNMTRATDRDTHDDEYILNVNGVIKGESSLSDSDTSYYLMPEFTVQVGTIQGTDGFDDNTISPYVGYMSIADTVVDESGSAVFSANQKLQYKLGMTNGAGIAVGADGSILFMDQFGGTVSKFTSGSAGEKSIRVEGTYVAADGTEGGTLSQATGSSIDLKPDGSVIIQDGGGRSITMDDTGMYISLGEAAITIDAKDITLMGNVNLGASVLRDFLMPASLMAAMYDLHIHAGPMGPPIVPFTALVLSGLLQASRINISA